MIEDPVLRLIARLPHAESDAVRSERVRARCHEALARRRRRESSRPTPPSRFWPFVAALGCVYVAEVIRQALRLYGIP